jgi:hypothetical protein
MKSLQQVFLFVVGALFLSQICHAAEDSTTTAVTIVSTTPESKAVDVNNDGKVTLHECLASAKNLFPEESAANHAAMAKGCLSFLEQQQTPGWSPTGEQNNADDLMTQMWAQRVLRTSVVIIVSSTPEIDAMDTNGDGKISFGECEETCRLLFPDDSREVLDAIIKGCMSSLQKQQNDEEKKNAEPEPEPKPVVPTVQPGGNEPATGPGPEGTPTASPAIVPTQEDDQKQAVSNGGDIPETQPGVTPRTCNSICCGDNCPTPVMAQTFMERLRERLHTLPGSIREVREDYISSRWLLAKAREYKYTSHFSSMYFHLVTTTSLFFLGKHFWPPSPLCLCPFTPWDTSLVSTCT